MRGLRIDAGFGNSTLKRTVFRLYLCFICAHLWLKIMFWSHRDSQMKHRLSWAQMLFHAKAELHLCQAAVGSQVNAGDEAAVVRSKEQNRRRHFLSAAQSPEGNHLRERRFQSIGLFL